MMRIKQLPSDAVFALTLFVTHNGLSHSWWFEKIRRRTSDSFSDNQPLQLTNVYEAFDMATCYRSAYSYILSTRRYSCYCVCKHDVAHTPVRAYVSSSKQLFLVNNYTNILSSQETTHMFDFKSSTSLFALRSIVIVRSHVNLLHEVYHMQSFQNITLLHNFRASSSIRKPGGCFRCFLHCSLLWAWMKERHVFYKTPECVLHT